MLRFSIIITCYNQGDLIREAVDSALAQNYRDREIIVVDDCSTDASARVLGAYGNAITLERLATNGGAVAARNRGAAIARGDFLVFLDGDDRLQPWALHVYDRVVAQKKPKLILAKMLYFTGILSVETKAERTLAIKVVEYEDYFSKDLPFRASASAMVIERLAFHSVGGWSAGTFPADDQDLLFKLGCSGPAVQILSPETSAYRLHEHNTTRHVQRLVDALYCLLQWEKDGRYPGGRERRFQRHAVMGGFVFFMVKQTWQQHLRAKSLALLAAGGPMVMAAIARKGVARLFGRNKPPEEILHSPRHVPVQTKE